MDQYRGSSRDLQGRSHLYSLGAWAVQVGIDDLFRSRSIVACRSKSLSSFAKVSTLVR